MPMKELSRLLSVSEEVDPGPAEQIKRIVEHNVQSGRFQRVCGFHERILTIEEYTDKVTIYYSIHHSFVASLSHGDPEAWELLWKRLFRSAYTMLLRYGWTTEQAYARAEEATQEASLGIYRQTYTYDCPFDAWTAAILRNHITQTYRRSHDPHDRVGTASSVGQFALQHPDDLAELAIEHELLLNTLGQLRTPAQRQVLRYLYFEKLSVKETAELMGRTEQAIYNLKRQALLGMRALLRQDASD